MLVDSLDYCIVCKRPHPHKHEVFFGEKARDKSIEYGYVLPLCYEDHEGDKGPHKNRQIDLEYKRFAQRHFEKNNGDRDSFIKIFGQSYL